nr:cytochrome P450 [Isodon lophanthoides var. gerardianus]
MEVLAVIMVVALGLLAWSQVKRRGRKLPPGPYPLPIVGNIFQVSSTNVQQSFAQLSKKYGPLMSIHLGGLLAVVVSSPEMAKEILSRQVFLDRPLVQAAQSHDHGSFSIGYLPVATQKWKHMRKICHEQMFTTQNLEKSERLRHQKLQQLIEYAQKCCDAGRAVNIREAVFTTTLNLMSVTLFSADATDFDSSVTAELREMIVGIGTLLGTPNYADFFPILKNLDPQGVRRQAEFYYGRLLRYVKTRIDQRIELKRDNPSHPNKPDDFLDKLLDITTPGSGYNLTLEDIHHLLVDLYIGGSESTIMSIEWILTELLQHPHKLSKVKDELRNVMGDRKMIDEAEDMPRVPYLQAVIKEAFRMHPPGPLLFPRLTGDDVEINGYFIPKGTHIHINAWAIGRDPSIWPNPECFEPERFLNTDIDYKGQNYELLPFGSGRRICPGLPVANRMVHSAMAALIHNFDWKFAPGQHECNKEILCGTALRREVPLVAIPLINP